MTGDRSSGGDVLVSLLLFAYNQESLVRAAIEGAFAQTYSPLEIILSDDASTDGTFRVMQEMAEAYDGPHSVVLNRNPQNLGVGAHFEHLVQMSRGAFVIDNSGDDISTPDRVARLTEVWLAGKGRVKAVHSARRRLDYEGRVHEVIDDRRVLAHMTPLEIIRDHGTLVGATLGLSKDLYDIFGPNAPLALIDDFPNCFRAALVGEIDYIPEPLLLYRTGGLTRPPKARLGQNYLYGFRIRNLRWHRSFWQCYLRDMEVVEPPDVEECRRLCREKIADADFHIGLSETPWWKLPLILPGNTWRSLRRRDAKYLRETLKYLGGPFYSAWHNFKGRRLA